MRSRTSSRIAAFSVVFCAFGLGIATGIGICRLTPAGPGLAGWHAGVKAGAEAQRRVDFAADYRNAPKPKSRRTER